MEIRKLKRACPHLERHLGELVKDGHVEHQAPQQVLQHGRADVPAGTTHRTGLSLPKARLARSPAHPGPAPPAERHQAFLDDVALCLGERAAA